MFFDVVKYWWNDKWKHDKYTCKAGFFSFLILKEAFILLKFNHPPLFFKKTKKKLKKKKNKQTNKKKPNDNVFSVVTCSKYMGIVQYLWNSCR